MLEHDMLMATGFGERLRSIRESCSLTQDMLAAATQIDRSTLAYYESGRVLPSINRIRRLAVALSIPTDLLLQSSTNSTLLADPGMQDVDEFFSPDKGSFAATGAPDVFGQGPTHLGELTQQEQLLILYYRQLEDLDRALYVTDIARVADQTQAKLDVECEDDIVLDDPK